MLRSLLSLLTFCIFRRWWNQRFKRRYYFFFFDGFQSIFPDLLLLTSQSYALNNRNSTPSWGQDFLFKYTLEFLSSTKFDIHSFISTNVVQFNRFQQLQQGFSLLQLYKVFSRVQLEIKRNYKSCWIICLNPRCHRCFPTILKRSFINTSYPIGVFQQDKL